MGVLWPRVGFLQKELCSHVFGGFFEREGRGDYVGSGQFMSRFKLTKRVSRTCSSNSYGAEGIAFMSTCRQHFKSNVK